jgi:micrococcal nuclease
MQSSSKLFYITLILVLLSGFLFYKGVEQEILTGRQIFPTFVPSMNPSSTPESVLGEEIESSASAKLETKNLVKVEKVVDGDTIEVLINGQKMRVRLIGVDTPETVDPSRPKGCFGKEASDELKRLLDGKNVILEKDVSETDKYQRLLRYVYLPLNETERLFVNDYLIREGYGTTLSYPPDVKFSEQFVQAQRVAKESKKGLWGMCNN